MHHQRCITLGSRVYYNEFIVCHKIFNSSKQMRCVDILLFSRSTHLMQRGTCINFANISSGGQLMSTICEREIQIFKYLAKSGHESDKRY